MNLLIIGALGKMHEWEAHCKGAISNGVTKDELRANIQVIGIYCGVPQALECFRAEGSAMAERGWNKGPALSRTPYDSILGRAVDFLIVGHQNLSHLRA